MIKGKGGSLGTGETGETATESYQRNRQVGAWMNQIETDTQMDRHTDRGRQVIRIEAYTEIRADRHTDRCRQTHRWKQTQAAIAQ